MSARHTTPPPAGTVAAVMASRIAVPPARRPLEVESSDAAFAAATRAHYAAVGLELSLLRPDAPASLVRSLETRAAIERDLVRAAAEEWATVREALAPPAATVRPPSRQMPAVRLPGAAR